MSNLVKKLRTTLGWNQVDFARAIGRSYQSIKNYEGGMQPPTKVLKRMKDLADKHGLKELFAPAQPEQNPAPRPSRASDNQHWHDVLEEILASGDQKTIALAQQSLRVNSQFVRLHRARGVREKTG